MTSEQAQPEQPQPQQRQRIRQVKPIRLQERDLDMFVSLSIARYLSVYAIEWLHFNGWHGTGGWRERYKGYGNDPCVLGPQNIMFLPLWSRPRKAPCTAVVVASYGRMSGGPSPHVPSLEVAACRSGCCVYTGSLGRPVPHPFARPFPQEAL
jgi:hypothetical protein